MENTEEKSVEYLNDLENMEENSEKIWKIWKKAKLNSGKIWKIKWWQTFVRNIIIEINNVIMKIKCRGRADSL